MRTSTELHRRNPVDVARDAEARGEAPLYFLWREPASNDTAHVDPPSSREQVETWMERAVAANGFGATPETVTLTEADSWTVHRTARAYRAYALGEIIAALLIGVVAFVREAHARWLQRRQARAINGALAALDDRTLRDLGMHRSEIGSRAAEVTGDAERTQMLAVLTRNGFLM